MLKWLMLSSLLIWSGCDAARHENERNDIDMSDAELHHNGDHGEGGGSGEGSGDNDEDSGEDTSDCGDDDPNAPPCDEQAALAAFQTNLQPAIDKSCNLCHASGAGGLTMVKETDDAAVVAQNRTNLRARAASASAEKLFLKISNQSTEGHGGGDQSDPERGNLTLAKIEAWFAAEVGCD